ncbi:3'-5' exonuclease [Deinococcus cellulosilyticus]|nr:3'-5' exonuclease [Deinococcus cellulosilyticus]
MKRSLPHYRHWNQVPEDLATKTELGKEGLQPGGAPVATMSHGARNRQPVELFSRSEAVPKRKPSERELGILLAAGERRSTTEAQQLSNQVEEWQQATLRELQELALLPPESWVTLDTETTDLVGEAISISVVSGTGEVLFNQLIRPTTPIQESAFEVHGISMQMLEDEPTFAEVYPELQKALQGKGVLAFNADFDRSTLLRTQKRNGVSRKDFQLPRSWHCLMLASSALFGKPEPSGSTLQDFRYLSLHKSRQAVARVLNRKLKPYPAHTSLGDAVATRELALMLFEYARRTKSPTDPQGDLPGAN